MAKRTQISWYIAGSLILLLMLGRSAYRYFRLSEFDSPDEPGSGSRMQKSTLAMLDKARGISGIPFVILSGVRTEEHNAEVGGVDSSAHVRGYAADIAAVTDADKKAIAAALVKVGFKRIGIGSTFVHADNDPSKPSPVAWGYPKGTKAPFDPFKLA